jgi:hypothetical protein
VAWLLTCSLDSARHTIQHCRINIMFYHTLSRPVTLSVTFIRIFLRESVQGAKPADAATTAYGQSLRKHHNFIVRGIFR